MAPTFPIAAAAAIYFYLGMVVAAVCGVLMLFPRLRVPAGLFVRAYACMGLGVLISGVLVSALIWLIYSGIALVAVRVLHGAKPDFGVYVMVPVAVAVLASLIVGAVAGWRLGWRRRGSFETPERA